MTVPDMALPLQHPLVQQALTHSSTLATDDLKSGSYERLEFLGDRILGFVIASMLFEQFPTESEGGLARRLSLMVSQPILALIAERSGLTPHIKISAKEKFAHDGQPSNSVLSDVVEAVIAALFLTEGWEPVQHFIRAHWQPILDDYAVAPVEPKTALQEWTQARGLALPAYDLVERSGPDHRPHFVVAVTITGHAPLTGAGASKQAAEKAAAGALLAHLMTQPTDTL